MIEVAVNPARRSAFMLEPPPRPKQTRLIQNKVVRRNCAGDMSID